MTYSNYNSYYQYQDLNIFSIEIIFRPQNLLDISFFSSPFIKEFQELYKGISLVLNEFRRLKHPNPYSDNYFKSYSSIVIAKIDILA